MTNYNNMKKIREIYGATQEERWPYPNVVPATSVNNEKYVKSSPNSSNKDNLLCLPRE